MKGRRKRSVKGRKWGREKGRRETGTDNGNEE